jgi:pentatricopeptide repeat protein
LIDSCARNGKADKAIEILSMMQDRGFQPNVRTYSILLHAFCQAGLLNDALRILNLMKRENLNPSEVSYSMLVHGFGKKGFFTYFIYT